MTSSVPGVETVHPREEWQDPAKPVTSSNRLDWTKVTMNVAHYTADDDLIDGDPGEHEYDLDNYIRDMQASYLRIRGYSVGYLWAVDWLGGAWELRGWDYRSAANTGDERKTGVKNVNAATAPILYLVDAADRLTSYAAQTGRALGAEAERRAGRRLGRPRPHSDLDFTSCCGDGIRLDIKLGLLDPSVTVQPKPPEPPVIPPTQPILPPSNGVDMEVLNAPIRMTDTRADLSKQKIGPGEYGQTTPGQIPQCKSLSITVTAVAPEANGYVTVWGSGARPNASCLNFTKGVDIANTTFVNVPADRNFMLFVSAKTHILVDVVGYQ